MLAEKTRAFNVGVRAATLWNECVPEETYCEAGLKFRGLCAPWGSKSDQGSGGRRELLSLPTWICDSY